MSEAIIDPVWNRIVELSRANNDENYGSFVARSSLDYYRRRLKQLDFQGYGDVLDVGCGFGQWLIALATLNKRVTGIDVHEKRIETCNELARDLWLDNVSAQVASAVDLPFPDESFDALFCYGVFMFLDRDKALAEFRRVLRPGGVLYVCTNARGWWLKLALENYRTNRNLAKVSWKAFWSGRRKGLPSSIDIKDVEPLLLRHNFVDAKVAAEGRVTALGEAATMEPHYDATYLGYDCVIEFTARKKQDVSSPVIQSRQSSELLDQYIERAISSKTYSSIESLRRFVTLDTDKTTSATKPSVIALARTVTAGIDRPQKLRRIFEMATNGATDQRLQVRACVTLVQKLFYHHFAVQPMVDGTSVLEDPLEVVVFQACRCGTAARFLIDLLLVNGIDARMVAGACHTAAEALVDGRWVLVDASLYPPGIFPLGNDGELLTIDELSKNPQLLDMVPSYVNFNAGLAAMFTKQYPIMAKTIERYLNGPLFPSVGYCASELGDPNYAGKMRRFRKTCGAYVPSSDKFGWESVTEETAVEIPILPLNQRPVQVADMVRQGAELRWTPAQVFDGGQVSYEVIVSEKSRNWSYHTLPVGFDFAIDGRSFITSQCQLKLPADLSGWGSLYVSVIARRADRMDAFHLPSEEFTLLDK